MVNSFRLVHFGTAYRNIGVLRLIPDTGSPAPCVIVLHGLGSAKEHTLTVMYRLASEGFDVLSPDLYLHGERVEAVGFADRMESDFPNAAFQIIDQTAADVPNICAELGIDYRKCGVLGISMGGFVAHALAVKPPQCAAVVAAISSPDWVTASPERLSGLPPQLMAQLEALSPVNHPDSYPPLPLLMLTGAQDDTVAPIGSATLFQRLKPLYAARGIQDALQHIVSPAVGHDFTGAMQRSMIDWFLKYL